MREHARDRLTLSLLAIGAVTLLAQVVILRELLVASFGSELIYVLGLGLLMLGTAAGALLARRVERPASISATFLLFALALPLLVGVARALRVIFRGTPGAYLPFHQQIAGAAMLLVPLGALGGALFSGVARTCVARGRTLADAYAIESLGGLAGGTLSTLFIALGVQNSAAAIACSMAAAVAALFPPARPRKRLFAAVLTLLALLAVMLSMSNRIDRALTAITHPNLLASRDTPYGRATITGSLGQVAVFQNDALVYETEGTSAEEFVHVAALEVKKPESVLILGGVIEGLGGEVAKHGAARVRDVEVDRRMVELALPLLPHARPEVMPASRPVSSAASAGEAGRGTPGFGGRDARTTRLTFEEPRRVLRHDAQQYDLILSAMPEPDSGQSSRFYTREFFALCSLRLSPGGVLAFRLQSSENLWTAALARRTASIVEALRASFADVLVLPGTVNVVLASNGRLERDPEVLARRFAERRIEAKLVSPAYLRYLLTNDRVGGIERTLARTRAPASRDARPVSYHYTLVLWLSRFFPQFAAGDLPIAAESAGAAAALMALAAFLLARRTAAARRVALVAFAGFAGVVLEGTLILAYQIGEGVLYQDLGLLITMFMAGLAAGSALIGRRAPGRTSGALLLAATAVTAALTAWSVSAAGPGLVSRALFLFAGGFMTGALFAYASSRQARDARDAVAPLYAADLAGGVAGALAGSLLLIPLAGLPAAALAVAALALLALLVV